MVEFLANDNPCGQILIHLASRGNAIIAELLRLKDYIPVCFKLNNRSDQQKYNDVICDYVYFNISDDFERKIENNTVLQQLDNEFRDNYMEILGRYFIAFENIHKYATDMNQFLDDLADGVYIQQNLENLLFNAEGKQLLCELLYLYGVMLLVLDIHIDGPTRERLVVSYYRYNTQRYSGATTVEDVCKLVRSTGLNDSKRPINYPSDYFKRIKINEDFVSAVINHLRTDDVYNQISAYPSANHKTTALSSQGVMLFISLFFDTSILNNRSAQMREIVDKFFPDNWVINIYMGITLNIIEFWEPFKAARAALNNTLETDNVLNIANEQNKKMKKCYGQIQSLLKPGYLSEDKIYDNIDKLLILCRDCNVTFKWLLLHTMPHYTVSLRNKKCKIRENIIHETEIQQSHLLEFLLNISEFELNFKEIIKKLLESKEEKLCLWKNECVQRMHELSEVFSGEKPLTIISKNENLKQWFANAETSIEQLNMDKVKYCQRKIIQHLEALEEVKSFHQIASIHQVVEYINESRKLLKKMVSIMNCNDTVLVKLQIIGDLSYAWRSIHIFTSQMQDKIKTDPSSVTKLRATFLKASSALEIPLLRINQAESKDLISVSEYYSQELVSYIQTVLHIIPETMFSLLAPLIDLQTNTIKEIPTRLEKDKVKNYAQMTERMEISRLTHSVSIMSEGILRMKNTLVGIIQINPKKLLEDGIRRELVKRVATALHTNIQFSAKSKNNSLQSVLRNTAIITNGFKRSLEYIQDYIGIYGLRIWQEEISRIMKFSTEMECNQYLRNKIQSSQSEYQNKVIPIPEFPPTDTPDHVNFVGRLLNELIKITNPKNTIYVEDAMAWFDSKSRSEVLNFKIFVDVKESIGVAGLAGLDRLICFKIVTKLQLLINLYKINILNEKSWSDLLINAHTTFTPSCKLIENPSKSYGQYLSKMYKVPSAILDSILEVGQFQILRQLISYQLEISCKIESKQLFSCLEAMNEAILNELKNTGNTISTESDHDNNEFPEEICEYLDWTGIGNPYAKIYVITTNMRFFPIFMSLFTTFQLSKLQHDRKIGSLIWKKFGDPIDGSPFVIGLQTLFRQFHPNNKIQFLMSIGQYLKSHMAAISCMCDRIEFPQEIPVCLEFMNLFSYHSGISKKEVNTYIPEAAEHLFESLSCYS